MLPSFIMGTGSALGEATIIGSLRNYPKNLINGWSSGTGLAGIFGALLTLIFQIEKIETQNLYLFVSPLALLYLLVFILQENYYLNEIKNENSHHIISGSDTDSYKNSKEENNELYNDNSNGSSNNNCDGDFEQSSTDQNYSLNLQNFKLAFHYSKFYIVNLGLVL